MKKKLIEVTTFVLFLLPLLVILVSPTFSSKALGLDKDLPDTQPAPGYATKTFYSMGGMYDGWILESNAYSGIGGSMNSTTPTMPLGDNAQNRQYRGIISFNTAPLPKTLYIDSATIYLRGNGYVGQNPFTGNIWSGRSLDVDLKKGSFSSNKYLELSDFRSPATSAAPVVNQYFCYAKARCAFHITSGFLDSINRSGLTQFRFRFSDGSDGNSTANNYQVFTGDTGTVVYRPMLVIGYYP